MGRTFLAGGTDQRRYSVYLHYVSFLSPARSIGTDIPVTRGYIPKVYQLMPRTFSCDVPRSKRDLALLRTS